MSCYPHQVVINEVGPRDGLQNEKNVIPTGIKIELINRLSHSGLPVIETTSFVSPKAIPQLADAEKVFSGIEKPSNIQYPVLIPNLKGFNRAVAVGANQIAVFTAASETFSQKNMHCSIDESLQRIQVILQEAKKHSQTIRGYISCVLGCPYEGKIKVSRVVQLAEQLLEMGCDEISLGDTIGVETPLQTSRLVTSIMEQLPLENIALHFHDTYGQALPNILICLDSGITKFDASVAGLGGCPYAPGASGNVATEDLVYMLHGMGISTGVDLNRLIETGEFISAQLKRSNQSRVALAKRAK